MLCPEQVPGTDQVCGEATARDIPPHLSLPSSGRVCRVNPASMADPSLCCTPSSLHLPGALHGSLRASVPPPPQCVP